MFEVTKRWSGGSPTAQSIVPLLMYFRSHRPSEPRVRWVWAAPSLRSGLLRQSLEFAGYAALVHSDPTLASIWWDRDQTDEDEKKARRTFTHGAVVAANGKLDTSLPGIYDTLYDRLIQFGAHPNEKSISGSMKLDIAEAERNCCKSTCKATGTSWTTGYIPRTKSAFWC